MLVVASFGALAMLRHFGQQLTGPNLRLGRDEAARRQRAGRLRDAYERELEEASPFASKTAAFGPIASTYIGFAGIRHPS